MELKRVIAKDNKAAMDQVVALYGPDALVVSGHRVRNQFELIVAVDIVPDLNPPGDDEDTWPLAAQAPNPVEATITASLDQSDVPAFRKVLFEPEAGTKTPASEADERSGAERARDAFRAKEVVDLVRSEIQILRQEIQLQHQTAPWWARTQAKDALNPVAELLVQSPIPGRLKTLLMDTIVDEPSIEAAQISLQNLLIEQLTVAEFDLEDYRGIHAFYGPSGVGKTTFVGKIALAAANQFGADDVVIISHVDHKLGAWNQTQMIAAEAGIRCYRATSNDMTRTLLRELSQYGCVLIDTAGVDWMATRDTLEALDGDLLHHLLVRQKPHKPRSANANLALAPGTVSISRKSMNRPPTGTSLTPSWDTETSPFVAAQAVPVFNSPWSEPRFAAWLSRPLQHSSSSNCRRRARRQRPTVDKRARNCLLLSF